MLYNLLLGKIRKKEEVEEKSRIVVACNIDRQAFEFMLKRNIERCRKSSKIKGSYELLYMEYHDFEAAKLQKYKLIFFTL